MSLSSSINQNFGFSRYWLYLPISFTSFLKSNPIFPCHSVVTFSSLRSLPSGSPAHRVYSLSLTWFRTEGAMKQECSSSSFKEESTSSFAYFKFLHISLPSTNNITFRIDITLPAAPRHLIINRCYLLYCVNLPDCQLIWCNNSKSNMAQRSCITTFFPTYNMFSGIQ